MDKLTEAFVEAYDPASGPEPAPPPLLRKVDLAGRDGPGAAGAAGGRRARSRFARLFSRRASRWDWIVTFLAVLELVHMGSVRVRQPELFGELHLELAAS